MQCDSLALWACWDNIDRLMWMATAPPYPLQDFKALYKCCIIIIIIVIIVIVIVIVIIIIIIKCNE